MEIARKEIAAEHRKRRRRRHFARQPLCAWVQLDGELRGNEAILPRTLASEVFRRGGLEPGTPRYVAVAPWTPTANTVETSRWTVVPVREVATKEEDGSPRDIIKLPGGSPASFGLLPRLEANPFGQQRKRRDCYEIHVAEVQPLELDKIYITVEGDALRKHEEVQSKFGGGFVGKGKSKDTQQLKRGHDAVDDELVTAVRKALKISVIAREGDYLPLPLPAHPITHVPLPPAQIVHCEPLGQGLPTEATKIVVNRTYIAGGPPQDRPLPVLSHSKSLTDFDITDGDATSNEAYHSAQENGDTSDTPDNGANGQVEEESDDDSDSTSSDSDEMISMTTPSIMKRSSAMSSKATATPRGYAARTNGIGTPGSIFSNMTGMTSRRDQVSRGKTFKAHSLQYKIPTELLYPSPSSEDDDECRVFVDIKVLVRLGCFSGDWVKIASAKPQSTGQILDLTSLNQDLLSRPAKIFGIPDIQPPVARETNRNHSRRSSIVSSSAASGSAMNAWLPPALLVNLKSPEHVRISVLQDSASDRPASRSRYGVKKLNSSDAPPIAQEMTLLRISTPLTTERALQNGLFTALKHHFQARRRLVKQGDVIAVPFDAQMSRFLASSAQGPESENELEEALSLSAKGGSDLSQPTDIAWFRVGSITGPEPLEASDLNNGKWNGVFSVEPDETRLRQNGSHQCRLPHASKALLSYYRKLTPPSDLLSNSAYTRSSPRPYISTIGRRLKELMAAATSRRAMHLKMDPVIILLHSSQRNIGKSTLAKQAAEDLGLHTFDIDSYDLLSDGNGAGDVKAEALLKARIQRALASGAEHTSLLIRHIEVLTADRMATAFKDIAKDIRVLVATTTDIGQIPDTVRGIFTHEIEINAPDEGERAELFHEIIRTRRTQVAKDVDINSLAVKTAALVAGNLVDIISRAEIAHRIRLSSLASTTHTVQDVLLSGGSSILALTNADFTLAIDAARKNFADSIGAPKIPTVSWSDVGGLTNVKDSVLETIQLPLEHPELFAKGMKKRSGILFYGPPGTGKTLLAKAIATEFSLNFFSVKGPELLNMYIGESEANVRRVFQRARDARPCVVFFDELDSVAPKRGNQGDSGGVMDRIVSQILAELDGMSDGEEGAGGVFVIGATNRPDLLDPALLRPGRFDKMLYLGVSDTHAKQKTILEALTRKFVMDPGLDLGRVAEALPFTYTGADLYALCSDAMLKAITRQAEAVDAKVGELERQGKKVTTAQFFDHYATKEDVAVIVREEDFEAARRELVPSVR